jgi:hypothetical protein
MGAKLKEKTMPKGRRVKIKAPTKLERAKKLNDRILGLVDELVTAGFGTLLKPPGRVELTEPVDEDPKTGGYIGKVKEPLGVYLQRVSIQDNYAQRPPFDHAEDSIYRRLIRDFIDGAAMPESKLAALSSSSADYKAGSLDDPKDIKFSVIDGLQRLYCFCLAVLLVFRREKLVDEGLVSSDAWKYFSDSIQKAGDAKAATKELLQRRIRYEVFFNIDLGGLLHYMVTFNTGQRRMNLPVQLEIMQRPLIEELEKRAKIPIWKDIQKLPGGQKPKDQFAASDLVLATQAFITHNAQVTASNEAERFLNEDQRYLDNVGDIRDVVTTLKRIGTDINGKIATVYASDINKRYILSSGGTFLIALAAACGYIRTRNNMKMLEGALEKLEGLLDRSDEDPLKLDEYFSALQQITASRGKTTRRLVDDTFRRFFMGATTDLEWMDTARHVAGIST